MRAHDLTVFFAISTLAVGAATGARPSFAQVPDSTQAPKVKPPQDSASQAMGKKQAKREETINSAPDWFFNPPRDTAFVLITATATSSDLQLALDKARLQARMNIAEELSSRLEGLGKRFVGEVKSTGAKANLVSQYEQTTKNVVSQVLVGSRVREQQWYAESDGYRVYVLMELPVSTGKKELVEEVKANKVLYAQLKTSKSFADLEKEVAKLTGGSP